MLLNFVKLTWRQLSGVAICWIEIFLGGNFPGGNFPGVELSGWKLSSMGIFLGGSFPDGNCPVGIIQVRVFMLPASGSHLQNNFRQVISQEKVGLKNSQIAWL